MGPFEKAVLSGLTNPIPVEESIGALLEAPKVDYWRTTSGGHRVGFSGKPGKGTPVAGNPHAMKGIHARNEFKKASKAKADKAYRDRLKKIKQSHKDKAFGTQAEIEKRISAARRRGESLEESWSDFARVAAQ